MHYSAKMLKLIGGIRRDYALQSAAAHDTRTTMHAYKRATTRWIRCLYTDKGLLPCERDGGNRRAFNEESVNWMQDIKSLKGCGTSIEAIQEYCRLCLLEESEENLRTR